MRVAVTVLNWNTRDYLRAFLPALLQSCNALGSDSDGSPTAEVIVADSGSTDGSLEVLHNEFPQVRCIPLGHNYGFTGGYIRAFEELDRQGVQAEFLVLLNSDIEVSAGWLGKLLAWMDTHPDCGICGPKLHGLIRGQQGYERSTRFEYAGAAGGLLDRWGFPYCRGRVRNRMEEDHGQYDAAAPDILWVTGACLMIRRSLWDSLGGLDDRFFAHQEEIDLCWRAQLSGWKVQVVTDALVWHLGGGTLPKSSPLKLKLNFRNNLLMLEKNLCATHISNGCSAKSARKKARRLIRFRLFLDSFAGIAYFCSCRPAYAKAVLDAHREWKNLRADNASIPAPGAKVHGITRRCILIK